MADENQQPPQLNEEEEKVRRAAEIAEQAKLPYEWTQTIRDVDVTIPVPGHLRGKDLDVLLAKDRVRVGVKGETPILEVFTYLPTYLPTWGLERMKKRSILINSREPSPTRSTRTNHPGRSRQHAHPRVRKSPSTWTKSTR